MSIYYQLANWDICSYFPGRSQKLRNVLILSVIISPVDMLSAIYIIIYNVYIIVLIRYSKILELKLATHILVSSIIICYYDVVNSLKSFPASGVRPGVDAV